MRRGSFKSRLPRGRLDRKRSPALLGVAIFIGLLVVSFFYLFPDRPDFGSLQSPSCDLQSCLEVKSVSSLSASLTDRAADAKNEVGAGSAGADAISRDASISAAVSLHPEMSQVSLENNGSLPLHQVQISSQGRSLGIISMLDCKEKKVLAVSGSPRDIEVVALDPDGLRATAYVEYIPSGSDASPASYSSEKVTLSTKSAPVSSQTQSSAEASALSTTADSFAAASHAGVSSPVPAAEEARNSSPIRFDIAVNKSDGRRGEVVGFRCTARNMGAEELSNVRICCAGKMASTSYLTPGKELYLDGYFAIHNDTRLQAGVQASNPKGKLFINNSSSEIRLISSRLHLGLTYPTPVHRGKEMRLQIRIENKGEEDLTDIRVRDGEGEIARVGKLSAGSYKDLEKTMAVNQSTQDMIVALARDASGREIYASQRMALEVFSSSIRIQGSADEIRIYPGEPAQITWHLSNTGEEPLYNITLEGDGDRRILKELAAGQSVDMAAIYSNNQSAWINVTARGFDGRGFEVRGSAGVRLQAIRPGITLKAMPSEVETCPGEVAQVNVLVSNSGDDCLEDVVLNLNGTAIARLGRLSPGEFRVINSRTLVEGNCSIDFVAAGRDSADRRISEKARVRVNCVVLALKVFASASPAAVAPGESCKITCTIANTGMVPLSNIFVISKRLGPLGNIEYLYPKRQMTVVAEKKLNSAVEDTITAEGFTQERTSVRASTSLSIKLLSSLQPDSSIFQDEGAAQGSASSIKMAWANISFGNVSQPFNLPVQEEAERVVSEQMASDVDRYAMKQNNAIMEGISNLLRYVEKLLGLGGTEDAPGAINESQMEGFQELSPRGQGEQSGSGNYELSIEGVKGSEHGAIIILDVNAQPSQPAANEAVKITAHLQSAEGIESALVKYGLSDLPLTRSDMVNVDRIYDCAMRLESGTAEDGYWSGSIPGRGAGTYMPLSVWITDGSSIAEGGPYLIHWSTVKSVQGAGSAAALSKGKGMLFIESSSVKGTGEVSIKDTIMGSTVQFNEKIKGTGSISLESLRCIDRQGSVDNFTEKKDLVFTDGNLKGHRTVASPVFQGGLGASVTERFNLSHVDRSETSSVSSNNFANNSLTFKTDQAFDGTWNIQTKYAKFYKKIKADQKYTGSFQTQKNIEFQDNG